MKKDDILYDKLANLNERISNFQSKYNQEEGLRKLHKNSNFFLCYNIFIDLLAGVITAFILNKVYTYFFAKNAVVLALLLVFCLIASMYNMKKFFVRK